ncbi:MAG: ABC-2 transporter permease [Ruminococcus sp.]|nr:ABC-2 transporter permease [Ruminococcus sp.]
MGGLIYKDFIINKKSIFMMLGIVMYCGIMFLLPNVLDSEDADLAGDFVQLYGILIFPLFFIITGSFASNIFQSNERKSWAYFISSTPMLKKHIEAKYWFVMIIALSTVFISSVFDAINCLVFDGTNLLLLISLLFYIQIFLLAFEIPFLVRFGSIGAYYKAGILVIGVLVVGIYLLFGDLSHFGTMDDFYEWFFKAMDGGAKAFEIFYAILPFVSMTAFYLSYRISCRLYLKGTENFEE